MGCSSSSSDGGVGGISLAEHSAQLERARTGSKMNLQHVGSTTSLESKVTRAGTSKSLLQGEATDLSVMSLQSARSHVTSNPKERVVLGKYCMAMGKESLVGEGSFSVVRRGTVAETGELVAVKEYKEDHKASRKADQAMIFKFKRLIKVLQELQEPFEPVSDESLWHEKLAKVKPSSLFMSLIDYSRGRDGEPGFDSGDGGVYVVTDLAQCSLRDFLASRRDSGRPLPKESVKSFTRAILLVVAGLHAKGLVHHDLKPENFLMFNGRLKLTDVDGCVPIRTAVATDDLSISYSPCYCAPEWAQTLVDSTASSTTALPSLDVWSAGMTICELISFSPVLWPQYSNHLKEAKSQKEANVRLLKWVTTIKKPPLPKSVEGYDSDLQDLLLERLLVCDPSKRKSCAQCLSHPFINDKGEEKSGDEQSEDRSETSM